MNRQDFKVLLVNSDMTVDNGAFTTTEIDTLGYKKMCVLASFGNVPANVASMTLTQSDTAGSGHSAYFTVGTDLQYDGTASALPTAAGGDGDVLIFHVDLVGKKRYHDLTCTAGNGSGTATEFAGVVILFNGSICPVTPSQRGADQVIVC